MAKIPEPYDRRILKRNLDRGLVSKADYQKYLDQLKDVANNAEVIELEMGGNESDDTPE